TGAGIEVDSKFIRMVEVRGNDGMGMEFDTAEVDDPDKPRGVVDDNLFRNAPGRERERHRAQPVGRVGRSALLIKDVPFRAVYKALENDGTAANSVQRSFCNRQVVPDDVQFRELSLSGEVGLRRVRHPDWTAFDR